MQQFSQQIRTVAFEVDVAFIPLSNNMTSIHWKSNGDFRAYKNMSLFQYYVAAIQPMIE